jgi:hypothetical protein
VTAPAPERAALRDARRVVVPIVGHQGNRFAKGFAGHQSIAQHMKGARAHLLAKGQTQV